MYHCHMKIYLMGCQPDLWKAFREMAPLESFTHTFSESDRLQEELAAQAVWQENWFPAKSRIRG